MLPGPQLYAVQHQIVALRPALPRRRFQLIDILFNIPVKGCCALTQTLSVSLHSNNANPVIHANSHLLRSIKFNLSPRYNRNLPRHAQRSIVVLESDPSRTPNHQIAGLRSHRFYQRLHAVRRPRFDRATSSRLPPSL